MSRRKTAYEETWLRRKYPHMGNAELLREFEAAFGWAPTPSGLSSWASRWGLRKERGAISWFEHPEYDRFLRGFVPGHTEAEAIDAFEREFGVRLSASKLGNRKVKLGIRGGTVGGRFGPGHVPANKGRTWDEMGFDAEKRERMRSGQFKPGNLPWTTRAVGEERMTRDGYTEVHVSQARRERANDQWVLKHRLVWEEANGRRLAAGEVVMFADGDKANFEPGNLVAVTMAERAVITRLGLAYSDRWTLETAVRIARLKMAVTDAERRPRPCASCGREFKPRFARQRRCDACIKAGARAPRQKTKTKARTNER